jgi:myxalamid-type nonribosomal peptide synthetase MxaA
LSSERLSRLTPEQRARLLKSVRAKEAAPAIPRRDAREPLALSPAQLRMWFLEQLQSDNSGAYYVYEYLRLTGPLDEDALLRALREIVRRHDALRTSFITGADGLPYQVVAEEVDFNLRVVRASGAPEAQRIIDEEPLLPFDLAKAPLLRATLIRVDPEAAGRRLTSRRDGGAPVPATGNAGVLAGWTGAVPAPATEDHRLLLTMHHIISDGWSVDIIVRELAALYRGEQLPELQVQFGDVVAWQQQRKLDEQLAWWKETLAGVPDVLELPADHPRPAVQSLRGGRHMRVFPNELLAALEELAKRKQKTLFMAVVAAYETLLYRLTGQESFAIGTPVANRRLAEAEPLIGLFVNTVALRADLGDDPTFSQLLDRVRETTLDAFAHEEVPFDRVVDALGLDRDPARTPLFQTMLVFAAGRGESESLAGLAQEPIHPRDTVARFDLTLSFGLVGEELLCIFDYAAGVFEPATIERLARAFEHVLRGVTADSEQRVSRIPLFDGEERDQLLRQSHGPVIARPEGATLHGLFAAQVERTPDAAALIAPGRTISYRELDQWSDAIAAGIAFDGPIAILADRSPDAIAAILGILKAGRPYLPIDPATPAERLEWILADAGAQLLPLPSGAAGSQPAGVGGLRAHRSTGDDAAYIIYTSGSTGTPKGVVVAHRPAVNLALSFAELHGFASHRVLMIPPLSFDASVGDVFPALASGAALVLHPSPAELNADALARYCAAHRITAIDAPAALWRRWLQEWIDLPFLTLMMVGGESIPAEEVQRFARLTRGRVRFFNHYGPTEATVCATLHQADGEQATGNLPIGVPLPNVSAYVLDRWMEPVPLGVAGELYIGGAGVAGGYHNLPEQTAERFIPDPFGGAPGARLYRTGDLVRRLPDGALDFLGRTDRQIKLRGFRIEPGEIEAALVSHPGVRAAVVTKSDHRLVAYVVGQTDGLADFLRERLPQSMVPSAFVTMDALPLTANGKIDFRALPEPPRAEDRVSTPPRNETERALAEIWADVLERDAIGIDDDFFALGGDSLRTMPLIFKVRQRFGVELPLSAVFTAPTIRRFAPLLECGGQATAFREADISPFTIETTQPAAFPPKAAFLTGATGFLGAFLLDELLRQSDAAVYCLVRANDEDEGLRRIRENLANYGLSADLTRVIPVLGDLGQPRLGLDDATRAHLAATLDVIYHNGGAVNFIAPYELLEAANVHGTREVLELAATARIKPVHVVSTLGVHFTQDRIGTSVREGDPLPPAAHILGGYNQSKWMADRVALTAREAGLPVSLHRPARITGDSRSGALNPGDFFYSWIEGCVQLGAFPDDAPALNMSPVDHIARAIVSLSLSGSAPDDHHYFNNRTLSLQSLVGSLRRRGFEVGIVPFERWRDALRADSQNAFRKFASLITGPDEGEPFFDCAATEERLAALGIVCPSADETLLGTYLDRLGLTPQLQEVENA